MAEESGSDNKASEHWMNSKWRPAMGWMYMAVCITDFILYPVLWAIFQAVNHITPVKAWDPLTLQGAGLFHVAMGAVLGVAAFGRTQEKIAGTNNITSQQSSSATTLGNTNQPYVSNTSSWNISTTPSGKAIVPTGNDPEK